MSRTWKGGSKEGASLTLPSTLRAGYPCYHTQSLTVRAVSGADYVCKNSGLHRGILFLLREQSLADGHWPWSELWFFTRVLAESVCLISAQSRKVRLRFYKDPHMGMGCFPLRCSQTFSRQIDICSVWLLGCREVLGLSSSSCPSCCWAGPSYDYPEPLLTFSEYFLTWQGENNDCCFPFSFCFGYSL